MKLSKEEAGFVYTSHAVENYKYLMNKQDHKFYKCYAVIKDFSDGTLFIGSYDEMEYKYRLKVPFKFYNHG